MSEIFAVHFLYSNYRSANGNEKPWRVGERRSVSGDLVLCENGYHYSPDFGAALIGQWLYGPLACIVKVDDSGPKDETKGCSQWRELIEVYDVGAALTQFAFSEADQAVRVLAPKALRAAGLFAEASKLAGLPRIVDVATANSARYAANSARYVAESARNAAYSARNAAYSARNAAYSASYAADSASYAATSASNAATSASNAATSASNAADSARYAATSARNAADSARYAAYSARYAAYSAYQKKQAKRFSDLMAELTGWVKI